MGKEMGKRAVAEKRAKWNRRYKRRLQKYQARRKRPKCWPDNILEVGFWNIRALTDERRENVNAIMLNKSYDILCLAETWCRADSKSEPFQIEGYQCMTNEREGAARKGGGLVLFVKNKVKVIPYAPESPDEFEEVRTERIWALSKGSDEKIAFGFAYFAATSVQGHVGFNKKLYELLRMEATQLQDEGFKVVFMGDFNGHLGQRALDNPFGIEGDFCDQNQNGRLMIDFVESMGLEILNNSDVCKETFTRIEGGRLSVVDFGLCEPDLLSQVEEFHVDGERCIAQESNHCMLSLSIKLQNCRVGHWRDADLFRFQLREDTDYAEYRSKLTKLALECQNGFNELDIDSKAEMLEDMIVSTAKSCFKRKVYPPRVKPQM